MIQPEPILQDALIDPPWALPKGQNLPGTSLIGVNDWIRVDERYAEQMALRERLLEAKRDRVVVHRPEADAAAREALDEAVAVLQTLSGFDVGASAITCPDGRRVVVSDAPPMVTLGRLIQEDICLLQAGDAGHVMTSGLLCFPASWSLDQKMGRAMEGIHDPVDVYTEDVSRRVNRLFDALQVGRPIVRANCLAYHDFALFQPRREEDRRSVDRAEARFIRQERQCLVRLPKTRAVLFSIHTCVMLRERFQGLERAALDAYLADHAGLAVPV